MMRGVAVLLALLACVPCAVRAGELPKPLDYRDALMEYYAAYCDTLEVKEEEEAYLVLSPDKFARHAKDEALKRKDLAAVRETVEKAVVKINKGTHEYTVLLCSVLGEYNEAKGEFACAVAREGSCLDIKPLPQDTATEDDRQVLARGLLFNKVHAIKLFFSNPEEFDVLKCPAGKARKFLESAARAEGGKGKEVYLMMRVEVLPGNTEENKRKINEITKRIRMTGIESNYVMFARIKSIDVFDDTELKHKIGTVENSPADIPG